MFVHRPTTRSLHHVAFLSSTLLMVLSLVACGVAEGTASVPTPSDASHPTSTTPMVTTAPEATSIPVSSNSASGETTATSSMTLTPAATTTLSGSGIPETWQTYRSERASYTVEYPKGWSADEQDGTNGTARSIVTTFKPSGGGALILVTTEMRVPDQAEPLDMPNTRCQQVQGNRGIATRCLDTISRTTATTIVAQGKTYTITTAGKGMDQNVYQHVLDSFTPFATPVSQAQAQLEPLLFQPDDLPPDISASHSDDPAPLNFVDEPPAAAIIGQDFGRESRGAGRVSLLLYPSPPDLEQAYKRLTAGVLNDATAAGNTPPPTPAVGDKSVAARLSLASSTYGKGNISVIIFTRCHALVDIRLNEWTGMTIETATTYAKRLDARLSQKVCQ